MTRKPIDPRPGRRDAPENAAIGHAAIGPAAMNRDATNHDVPRRIDRLAEIVDRCTEARQSAEALNEKLLAYLLGMAIQETRAAMRQQVAAAAGSVATTARKAARPRRVPADRRSDP